MADWRLGVQLLVACAAGSAASLATMSWREESIQKPAASEEARVAAQTQPAPDLEQQFAARKASSSATESIESRPRKKVARPTFEDPDRAANLGWTKPEEHARAWNIHLQKLDTYAQEPRDPAWASRAEQRIIAEVSDMGERRAANVTVECRSTSCVVGVKFATPEAAGQNFFRLMNDMTRVPCEMHATLPQGDDAADLSAVQVHLDCTSQKDI